MPSTYTVNLGIEKPATGEQSGTWGDTTNVNFDILDQAINGAERVTLSSAGSSGSPNALIITNGAASDGRNKWIEFYSSGDLGGDVFVQLQPNDAEKIVFVRNSLAGSQSVLLFQGTYNSGRDLEIPAGVDMVVKFDGGGASAANVTDVYNNLKVTGLVAGTADINGGTVDGTVIGGASAAALTATTVVANTSFNIAGDGATVTGIKDEDNMASNSATKLATQQSIKAYVDSQVGTVDTLAEILANGNTTGSTDIDVDAAQKVQFRDAAIYINSSVDGQLDIVADTEIQIAATTIDINGAINASGEIIAASLDISGNVDVDGITNLDVVDIDGAVQLDATLTVGVDDTGYDVKFYGATGGAYMLWDESADDLILAGAGGLVVAGNVDFNGDLDVDGTTNLDVVDIDGAVDFASTTAHAGDATFADNAKAIFGAGSDLEIYHDGSNSYIKDQGTGNLNIQTNGVGVVIADTSASDLAVFNAGNGQVSLYNSGSLKLATTATGIDVTGSVTADGLTVSNASGGNVAAFTNTSSADLSINLTSGVSLITPSTGILAFGTSSTERMRIDARFDDFGSKSRISSRNDAAAILPLLIDASDLILNSGSGGNVGIGVTPTEKLDISQSVNNSVIAKVTNTNSGDLASGRVEVHNNDSSFGQLTTYSSGFDFNVLGSNAANWTFLGTSGANSNGLKIGTLTADPVVFGTSDLERMRIDASGLVTVGSAVASTNVEFRLNGVASKAQRIRFAESGVDKWLIGQGAASETDAFEIYNSNGQMSLSIAKATSAATFSGTVTAGGLTTTTGTSMTQLTVNGSGAVESGINFANGGTTYGQIYFNNVSPYDMSVLQQYSTGSLIFGTNDTERMRIDASGNLLVATTNDAGTNAEGFLFYEGSGGSRLYIGHANGTANGTQYTVFNYNSTKIGDITQSGTTAVLYNTTSDERLKENIADADDAGSKIDAIQVRKFDWKADGSHQDYGMVAQELMTVAPEAVHQPEDPEAMMGVDYSKLVPMMLKEIQSLRARIAALES
jgi:hypothetical protein